ncbi:MAG: helix-turn-helix domain-containing protein, partial [Candidatus Thermoplasmatota archaeon]|nr:helix-turn-helix domain-containing protein [Candidatus Thermoplasmatota archaeon]
LARYHIRVLVKSGLATERREGNLNLYYPKVEHELGSKEVVDQRVKDQLALLRRPVPLRIVLGLLDQEEGLSMGDVAEIADISRSTATYHVGNLEDEGLVHIRKEGRHRVVALTDAEATADLLASFPPPDDVVSGFIEMWDQLDL